MKKLILLILAFLVSVLLFKISTLPTKALDLIKTDPGKDSRCFQVTVKFNAESAWRKTSGQRYIMVGCDGQGRITNPKKNPPGCTGGLAKLKPGEKVTLGRCSCFFTDKGGCLKVGKELTIEPMIDGSKNRREVTVVSPLDQEENIKSGKCEFKVTNKKGKEFTGDQSGVFVCGTNEQKKNIKVNISCQAPPPPVTPSVTPPVTPPTECPVPGNVTNVKVTCPECKEATQ